MDGLLEGDPCVGGACPCGAEAAPSSGILPFPPLTATPWGIPLWDILLMARFLAGVGKWLAVPVVAEEEDLTNTNSSLI